MWVVVVNRMLKRADVVLVGPFASRPAAVSYVEASHDHDESCDQTCRYLDRAEARVAEVMYVNKVVR